MTVGTSFWELLNMRKVEIKMLQGIPVTHIVTEECELWTADEAFVGT